MPSSKTIDRIRQLQEWKKQRAKKEVDKINQRNTPRKDILRKQKEAVASPTMRSLKLYSKIGENADERINTPQTRKSSNLKRKSLKMGMTPTKAVLLTSEKKKMSSPFALRPSQSSNTPTRLGAGKKTKEKKTTRSHERTKSKENEDMKLTGISKNTKNRRRRRSRRNRKRRNSENLNVETRGGRRRVVSLQDSVQSFRDGDDDEETFTTLRATPMRQQDKIFSPSQPKSRDLKTTPGVSSSSLDEKIRLNTPISREQEDSATSPGVLSEDWEATQSSVKSVQDTKLSREIPQSQVRVDENPKFSDALEANSPTSKISESKVSDVMSADSKISGQEMSEKVHVEPSVWGGILSSAISTFSPTSWFGKAYEAGTRTAALDRLETSTPQSTRTVDDASMLFDYDEDHLGSPDSVHSASSVTRSQSPSNETVFPAVSSLPAKLHETHESISSSSLSSSTPEQKISQYVGSDLTSVAIKSKMSSPLSADAPKDVHEAAHDLRSEKQEDQRTRLASPEVIPEDHGMRRVRFDRVQKTSTSSKISVASPRTSVSPITVAGQGHADKLERHRTNLSSRLDMMSPTRKESHGEPAIVYQSESRLASSSCVEQDEIEKSSSIKTSRREHHKKISILSQDEKTSLDDPVTPMYVSPPWLPTSKVSPTESACPRQSKIIKSDVAHASDRVLLSSTIETMNGVKESKSEEDSIGWISSVHDKSSKDLMRTPSSVSDRVHLNSAIKTMNAVMESKIEERSIGKTSSAHDKSTKGFICTPTSISDRTIVHDVETQLTTSNDEVFEEPSFEGTPCFKFATLTDAPLDITTHAKRSNLDTPSSIVSEVLGETTNELWENRNDSSKKTKHAHTAEPRRERQDVVSLPTRKDVVRALHARHRSSMRSSIENCTACSACIIV